MDPTLSLLLRGTPWPFGHATVLGEKKDCSTGLHGKVRLFFSWTSRFNFCFVFIQHVSKLSSCSMSWLLLTCRCCAVKHWFRCKWMVIWCFLIVLNLWPSTEPSLARPSAKLRTKLIATFKVGSCHVVKVIRMRLAEVWVPSKNAWMSLAS